MAEWVVLALNPYQPLLMVEVHLLHREPYQLFTASHTPFTPRTQTKKALLKVVLLSEV